MTSFYFVSSPFFSSTYGISLCKQVINWLCTEGDDHLRCHATVADNLRNIEAQQLEYTKFQSVAEVCIRAAHL